MHTLSLAYLTGQDTTTFYVRTPLEPEPCTPIWTILHTLQLIYQLEAYKLPHTGRSAPNATATSFGCQGLEANSRTCMPPNVQK